MKTLWPYVDDEILINEIRIILKTLQLESEEIDIYRNTLDPFSAMFDMALQNISFEDWIEQEKARQSQKTMQNTVGYFHQHILGAIDGWEDTGSGGEFDLINTEKKIIVELKNKHNTFNSTSAGGTYRKMARHLDDGYLDYRGYVVTVIPKYPKRFVRPFAPSEPGESHPARNDLMIVDGASFYEIATGDKDALKKLYNALPSAIEHAKNGVHMDIDSSSEFSELFTKSFGG